MRTIWALAGMAISPAWLMSQALSSLSEETRRFVSVDAPVVALTNVLVIDGTGAAPRPGQTVVINQGRIAAVGGAGRVTVPRGASVMDLSGHTLIPGHVGLHNHMFYTAAGGRVAQLEFSAPRLYLASGVTTIRTTGSISAYSDINLKRAVDAGEIPGPRIHITAPYISGPGSRVSMKQVTTPDDARRLVRYWAGEGATWIKAYTDISRENLGAAIDEAHKLGLKVTGHLCSVTFTEAVSMGIDNLEHGLLTASDFDPEKVPDRCSPQAMVTIGDAVDLDGASVQSTIQTMIDRGVPMTSTLAVMEPMIPGRPTREQRVLDVMAPDVRQAYLNVRMQIDDAAQSPFGEELLKKSMEFERRFVEAGGVLAAGVDPTGIGGALPGFGDQRNYELLIEAGFTPAQTVQIMSANGARVLDVFDDLGTVEVGKRADLVVLRGNLLQNTAVINNVTIVFKEGVGYDSAKLIESVKGRVGIQ